MIQFLTPKVTVSYNSVQDMAKEFITRKGRGLQDKTLRKVFKQK